MDGVKFKTMLVEAGEHPVMVVGQNPGRQRKGQQNQIVWYGNRSADLLLSIIKDNSLDNLLLTNICNYQQITPERVLEGLEDIRTLINTFAPPRIIALGQFARDWLYALELSVPVVELPHPSYIARFNKDREKYARAFTLAAKRV